MTHKELIMDFIMDCGGFVTTNQLRDFARLVPMADANNRCRELYQDSKLQRRWLTNEEMEQRRLNVRVMAYYIPDCQKDKN